MENLGFVDMFIIPQKNITNAYFGYALAGLDYSFCLYSYGVGAPCIISPISDVITRLPS